MSGPKYPGFDTLSLHAGAAPDPATGARATPIHFTSSFAFKSSEHAASLFNMERAGHVYSRISNPTNAVLEERIAALEGGVAGMWFANYAQAPVLWLVPALGVLGSLVAAWGFTQRRELLTLLANGVAVASTVLCVGVSMFPFILPSSVQPRASLTVWDASSSHMILFIMLVASIVFIPIILAYTSWVYSVMRGKVTEEEIEEGGGHAY